MAESNSQLADNRPKNPAQVQDGSRVTPACRSGSGSRGRRLVTAAPGRLREQRPAGTMTGLRPCRWTGDRSASGNARGGPRPRKRVLELSGGVWSLPQAPRWNADRRARRVSARDRIRSMRTEDYASVGVSPS